MDNFLIALFGTSKTDELALPIFMALMVIVGCAFWVVMTIGKRRRKRLIDGYDRKLSAFSKQLRRNSSSLRKQS